MEDYYKTRLRKALRYPRLTLQNAYPAWRLPIAFAEKSLRQACNQLGVSDSRTLTLRLVDSAEGQALHQQFRGKNYPTNVLAFPGEAFAKAVPDLKALAHLGDLVLCLPVILAEAQNQGKTPLAHLQHLLIHGFLHLQGFDHEEAATAAKMEQYERLILLCLGLGNPYLVKKLD